MSAVTDWAGVEPYETLVEWDRVETDDLIRAEVTTPATALRAAYTRVFTGVAGLVESGCVYLSPPDDLERRNVYAVNAWYEGTTVRLYRLHGEPPTEVVDVNGNTWERQPGDRWFCRNLERMSAVDWVTLRNVFGPLYPATGYRPLVEPRTIGTLVRDRDGWLWEKSRTTWVRAVGASAGGIIVADWAALQDRYGPVTIVRRPYGGTL